ncbi:8-amino-7-oxononanoate synthase [Leptolyngbya sp. NK1-12]|uniref:8-amino-7-ketopelargonate synthase n=1 Tax=Leptolyngbya sp. NK1-12 TaxID=2547451 RepID=A0AA96WHP7_9CYAN|nr:8-amino-7-oxononanoate synthase [Leptolyngbya sp. NK1-12]WNZ25314.1 8-amino-7-oxononanoate synthase [Leptolyngbya sp. NK1-12]
MVQNDKFAFIESALTERVQSQRLRSLQPLQPIDAVHVVRSGQVLLNFSSNDYLGLSKHPTLIAAAQQYTEQYGTGATASRLVSGTYEIHQNLEEKLALACGREAALLFNSGFQANSTILAALLDRQSLVLCDRYVHNSLLQGILASGARFKRYAHNDLHQLEAGLQQAQQTFSRILIATETVFSMDGDRCDLDALIDLADRYGAILYLDDAHAVGVLGQDGMGLAAHRAGVDLVIGTFGKAFGTFGAFVTCSRKLRDYLINYCPGFIYTTALPPAVIGAIEAALFLMPTLEAERQFLIQQSNHLRTRLQSFGYDTGASGTQIIPVILGAEEKTLSLSGWLEQQGILATAIRPPTVAAGTARIRLALSSCHTPEHLDRLIGAIQTWSIL